MFEIWKQHVEWTHNLEYALHLWPVPIRVFPSSLEDFLHCNSKANGVHRINSQINGFRAFKFVSYLLCTQRYQHRRALNALVGTRPNDSDGYFAER